jgi:hypothetical protein
MYKYSLLYLFLLFVAMGVDRALPFWQLREPVQLVLLRDMTASAPEYLP